MALPYRAVTPFFAHAVPAAVFVTSLWFFGPANSPLDRYDHSLDNHDDNPYGLGPNVPDHQLTEGAEHLSAAPIIFDVPTSTETETQYITVTTTQVALPDDYVPMRSGTRNFRSRHADLILANSVDSPVSWFKNNAVFRFFNAALFIPMFDIFRYFIEVAILMPHYFVGALIAAHTMAGFVIFMAMCLYNWWQRRRSRQQPSPQSPPTSPPPPGGNGPPPPGGGGPPPDDSPPGGSPPSNAPAPPATPGPKPRDDNRFNFSGPTVETSPRSPALDAGRLTADLTNAVEAQRVQTLETNLRVCNETSQIKTQTIQDRDVTIERLEAENKLIHERRNSTSSDISDLRIKLRTAQTALAESDEQLRQERENAKKATDRASDITSRNMSQRTAHDTLRKRCTSLEDDLQRVRHDRDSATTERDNLKAALAQQEADAEKARVDAVDRAYTTANREHNDLKRRHTVLENELAESRRQLAELRAAAPPPTAPAPQSDGADVAALRQEIEKLNASLAEEQKKVASANADGMSERLAAFGSPRSKDKYDQAVKEASDSRSEVASLTSEKQRLVQQNERLLREQKHGDEVAERRQKAAEAELQRSKDAEQRATTSLERSQAQVDTLSRAKSDAETATKEQQYAAAQAQKAQQEAEQRLEESRIEIERLNQQLAEVSRAQRQGSDALQQQQQQASSAAEQERLQNVVREAERRAAQHEEETKQAEQNAARLEREKEQAEKNAARLEREREQAEKKAEELNAANQQANNDRQMLQNDLYTAAQRNHDLDQNHMQNINSMESNHRQEISNIQTRFEGIVEERLQQQQDSNRAEANTIISGLQSTIERLNTNNHVLQQERDAALNSLPSTNNDSQADRRALEARNLDLIRQLNDALEETEEVRDQVLELTDEKHTLETHNSRLKEELLKKENDLQAVETDLVQHETTITQLRGEAVTLRQLHSNLIDTNESMSTQNFELDLENTMFRPGAEGSTSTPVQEAPANPNGPERAQSIEQWSAGVQTSPSHQFNFGAGTPNLSPRPSPVHTPNRSPSTRGKKRNDGDTGTPDTPVMRDGNSPFRKISKPVSPRRNSPVRTASPLRNAITQRPASPFGALTNIPQLNPTGASPTSSLSPIFAAPFNPHASPSPGQERGQQNVFESHAASQQLERERLAHEERKRAAELEHAQLQQSATRDALGDLSSDEDEDMQPRGQNASNANADQDTDMDTGGIGMQGPASGTILDPALGGGVAGFLPNTPAEQLEIQRSKDEEEERERKQIEDDEAAQAFADYERQQWLRAQPNNHDGKYDSLYNSHKSECDNYEPDGEPIWLNPTP
ncbi:hypothetical protein D6D10_08530 [Aureobasidium pullulans]|uniref:Uncharacterized protein n=1 Tax=Aureobasidium pullulans TaxID=5580 RepID=A0A4S9EAB3_AURPU|nr:hypothetical protein D6D10_08530 [Aureobasidium pullulans]